LRKGTTKKAWKDSSQNERRKTEKKDVHGKEKGTQNLRLRKARMSFTSRVREKRITVRGGGEAKNGKKKGQKRGVTGCNKWKKEENRVE